MSLKTKANKNTWGLVRMDGTSKLYYSLKVKRLTKTHPRDLWKSDWRK